MAKIPVINDNDTVMTYQAGPGVSDELMPNRSAVLAHRYMSTPDPEFKDEAGDTVDMGYDGRAVDASLRYSF